MIHFNNILESTPRLNTLSLSFMFPHRLSLLPHSYFMSSPQQLLDVSPRVSSTNHEAQWCYFLKRPVTSSLVRPNIALSTPFPHTLRRCFPLNVRGQVPHSFKSHIKLQFCTLSPSHFQLSNGRFWTELRQATTKRDMTCPVSTTAWRQNLCARFFTYSPPLRYFNLQKKKISFHTKFCENPFSSSRVVTCWRANLA